MGCTLLPPQTVASLWSDEVFSKNILYFWAASQRQILKPCFKDQHTHRCFAQMPSIQQKLVSGWEIDDTHICAAFTTVFTTHWNVLTAETAFLTCISSIAIYKSAIHKTPFSLGSSSQVCEIMDTAYLNHTESPPHFIASIFWDQSGQNYIRILEVQVLYRRHLR